MKNRAMGLGLAMLLALGVPVRSAEPTAVQLAQALQKKYDGIRDFSADFVHSYRGGVLRKQLSEKGRLLVKKPGKMRWEYIAPEPKTFISDGQKIYSYIPADKQVLVTSVPKDDTATTPALFLAGKGSLTRDFTVSAGAVPDGFASGTLALKLLPKTPQPDYDSLILLIDPSTFTLRGMITADPQGGTSTLAFANLKENTGVADKEFVFNIPRGVDVVSESGKR
jgi:outer membrane lipoprotein carrier protein